MEKSEFDEALSEFDIEPELADALESVFDKPIVPAGKRKERKAAEYRMLAMDTRALHYRQRIFLRYLLANQMRPSLAIRAMNNGPLKGQGVKEATARHWMCDPHFKSIVDRYTQLALEHAGVGSPAQILLRIDSVVENALEPVPMYHAGTAVFNPMTGQPQMEVDRGSALKGLEMLGKAAGAFRKDEENSQRVTVVLDFSGEQMQGEQESEIIEGEATEVPR